MQIELFYDVISPWSYLCFEVLGRYRRAWDIDLVMRPAFLGGVFAASGNAPPASVPARGAYLVHDLARTSRQFAVPLQFPSTFPINTIAAMRLLTLIAEEHPRMHEDAARLLWQRYWHDDVDVADLAVLRAACVELGLDEDLVARGADDDNKTRLREATNEAVARGAFGFPAMFVNGGDDVESLYFGSDRLALLAFDHDLPWVGPVPPEDF